MAWQTLLTRARNRRSRLVGDPPGYEPEPAPAHDLVIRAIEAGMSDGTMSFPRRVGVPLCLLLRRTINVAWLAECQAQTSGSMPDRQTADEALAFAIRVAGRVVEEMESKHMEV